MIPRLLALAGLIALTAQAESTLQNDQYILKVAPNGIIAVTVKGMPEQTLKPEFTVIYGAKDPKAVRIMTNAHYEIAPRSAVRWNNMDESVDEVNEWLSSLAFKASTSGKTGEVMDTGKNQREWVFKDESGKVTMKITGPRALETSRPFSVGEVTTTEADSATVAGNVVTWNFPESPNFKLSAELTLPTGKGDPSIRYTLTPVKPGYFSVAFTGAAATPLRQTLSIPQEMDRSHKQFDFVMCEPDLHLPRVQVTTKEGNIALVADPMECRFRLPTLADSRFGVMLQNTHDDLKPVMLAPIFGGPESKMEAGEPWSFTLRYVQKAGDWKDTFNHIARNIHGFRDQRDNSGAGSLNGTIERIIDFLTNKNGKNYAMWDNQQKYYDYFTDKTGIFKPFSALYGLSGAVVTDDEAFYLQRALPAMEYAISRPFFVFAPYDNSDNKQANSAVRVVGQPYPEYAQLVSFYEMLQKRTPVLLHLAEKRGLRKGDISDMVARWRLTGDAAVLAEARKTAEKQSGRSEEQLFDLLEVAEASKEKADMDLAKESAYYNMAQRLNLYPVPPDTMIKTDIDGKVPVHKHSFSRHGNVWGYPTPEPVQYREQTVPAWRLARLGVASPAYPMEYWMNTHGVTLRIGGLTEDTLLRDVAHWGVVGRFGNFPGDNRTNDSLIPEAPDAVEAPPWKWNFATVNPGHAWDFLGSMMDFLISDAFERSKKNIDFPAVSASGSGFRVRIYGSGPGRFYGDKGVYLWLPRGLLNIDNKQVDWLAGHGNGNLYLALWNQSYKEETVTVAIDPALAASDATKEARVWVDNAPVAPMKIADNRFTIKLPAKGITALAIPAETKPRLQAKLYDPTLPALGPQSFTKTDAPFGPVHAMLIRSGRGLTTAFVYTEALPENVIAARLRWKQGDGDWQVMDDAIYPYEFSPAIKDDGDFACVLEIEGNDQKITQSPVIVLSPTGDVVSAKIAAPGELPFPPWPSVATDPVTPPQPLLEEEFVEYIKKAANPDSYGLRDGKFYPYSTPQGRRIGYRQPVWSKTLFATGCTPQEAEQHLRDDLARTQAKLTEQLAARQPKVDFAALEKRQRETLLDLAYTEGTLQPDLLEAIVAGNWDKMIKDHLYVRYGGHAPDHVRNKAFAKRWEIE